MVGRRMLSARPKDTTMASPGKKGPNGPALLTSHLDAIAISRHPDLLKSIKFFSPFLAEQVRGLAKMASERDQANLKLCISRLSFIPEGGMKTRVIAIGDF